MKQFEELDIDNILDAARVQAKLVNSLQKSSLGHKAIKKTLNSNNADGKTSLQEFASLLNKFTVQELYICDINPSDKLRHIIGSGIKSSDIYKYEAAKQGSNMILVHETFNKLNKELNDECLTFLKNSFMQNLNAGLIRFINSILATTMQLIKEDELLLESHTKSKNDHLNVENQEDYNKIVIEVVDLLHEYMIKRHFNADYHVDLKHIKTAIGNLNFYEFKGQPVELAKSEMILLTVLGVEKVNYVRNERMLLNEWPEMTEFKKNLTNHCVTLLLEDKKLVGNGYKALRFNRAAKKAFDVHLINVLNMNEAKLVNLVIEHVNEIKQPNVIN